MLNSKYIREIGFKTDQDGIIRRYLREQKNWKTHLDKSKEFILHATSGRKNGTVAILGSGWLLDVPIDQLLEKFDKVMLVDINHPKQIQHKYRKNKKIQFVWFDLNGELGEKVYSSFQVSNTFTKDDLKNLDYKEVKLPFQADYVISLNVLNQLDIILCDYMIDKNPGIVEQLISLRVAIQNQHLGLLPVGFSCLIVDYEEHIFGESTEAESANRSIFIDLPTGRHSQKWNWNFDSLGFYRRGKKIELKVIGIVL